MMKDIIDFYKGDKPMTDQQYPIGGYAPGNYQRRCSTCNDLFIGNKEAFQCESCAIKDKKFYDGLTPEQKDRFDKRFAEIAKLFFENIQLKEEKKYQLCPKCLGQKTVSRPPMLPADISEWTCTTQTSWPCDICSGAGILPTPFAQAEEKKRHAIELAQYASEKEYWYIDGYWYLKPGSDEEKRFTSEELYNLFNPPNP